MAPESPIRSTQSVSDLTAGLLLGLVCPPGPVGWLHSVGADCAYSVAWSAARAVGQWGPRDPTQSPGAISASSQRWTSSASGAGNRGWGWRGSAAWLERQAISRHAGKGEGERGGTSAPLDSPRIVGVGRQREDGPRHWWQHDELAVLSSHPRSTVARGSSWLAPSMAHGAIRREYSSARL